MIMNSTTTQKKKKHDNKPLDQFFQRKRTTCTHILKYLILLQANLTKSANGNNTKLLAQETYTSCLAFPFHSYVMCCISRSVSESAVFFIYH